jgi:solute carrier family 25 protein 16
MSHSDSARAALSTDVPHRAAAAVTALTPGVALPASSGVPSPPTGPQPPTPLLLPSAATTAQTADNAQTANKVDKQSWSFVSRSLLSGGIAGCVAKTAVAPLDRVKILFQGSNPTVKQFAGTLTGGFRAVWWYVART